ncbi:MAG: glycosyltransferase family 9 protein [Candidatus Omnitrophota bacterium]
MKHIFKNKFYKFMFFIIDAVGFLINLPFVVFRRKVPGNVGNILLIRLDHIGDVICSTPIPQSLKEHYRGAKITYLVSNAAKDVVLNNPYVDEVICYDAPWFNRNRKRVFEIRKVLILAKELRRHDYDIGIDLRGDFRHILLMLLSGVKFKIGYGITGGGFLLNHRVPYRKNLHSIERNLDCLRSMDIKVISSWPQVFTSEKDEKTADKFLESNNILAEDFVVVMHPYAGYSSKNWLDSRFAELIKSLHEKYNAKVIIVGSGIDKNAIDGLIAMSQTQAINTSGMTSLSSLMALINKASVFVGVDSGPSHIASLTKTPCLILYSGTNNAWEWGPRNDKAILMQNDIPCKGCEKLDCEHNICMDLTTVGDVLDAVEKVISLR